MKKVVIIIILLIIGYGLFYVAQSGTKNLASPKLGESKTPKESPIPTPTPKPTPQTFQFDASTDLNAELEKVNPQVLDSDFN